MIGRRFQRASRLLHPKDFENVLRRREVQINVPPLQIIAVVNDLNHPRLGLVIGKRVSPRAVDRNRMRRTIREAFRHNAGSLPALDIVVMQRQRKSPDAELSIPNLLEVAWRRLRNVKAPSP